MKNRKGKRKSYHPDCTKKDPGPNTLTPLSLSVSLSRSDLMVYPSVLVCYLIMSWCSNPPGGETESERESVLETW